MPKRNDIRKIMLIGSGPVVIGQGCEFDYSGVQACKVLRQEGFELVLVNSNPATIMTDPEFADRTYIEPLTVESLHEIIRRERPDALLPTLGGQTALNLAMELAESGIDRAADAVVGPHRLGPLGGGGQRFAGQGGMEGACGILIGDGPIGGGEEAAIGQGLQDVDGGRMAADGHLFDALLDIVEIAGGKEGEGRLHVLGAGGGAKPDQADCHQQERQHPGETQARKSQRKHGPTASRMMIFKEAPGLKKPPGGRTRPEYQVEGGDQT